MSGVNLTTMHATRKMLVGFVGSSTDGVIELELGAMWCREIYYIALSVTDPVISEYADENGQLDSLFELQGHCVILKFAHAITDLDIECTAITQIKKVKWKA